MSISRVDSKLRWSCLNGQRGFRRTMAEISSNWAQQRRTMDVSVYKLASWVNSLHGQSFLMPWRAILPILYKCTGNLNRNTPMLSLYWNHIYHLPGSKYWSTLRRGYDHPSCNEPKHWAALLGHEFTRGPFWISRDKAWSINMAGSWSESTKRKCIQWQADWALLWKES